MPDDGCKTEGCSGDPDAEIHTLLAGQYSISSPDTPSDSLPDEESVPETNPAVAVVKIAEVVGDTAKSFIPKTQNNVTVFISYVKGADGTIYDIKIIIKNKSGGIIWVGYVKVKATRYDTDIPDYPKRPCRDCTECGNENINNKSAPLLQSNPSTITTYQVPHYFPDDFSRSVPPFSANITLVIQVNMTTQDGFNYHPSVRIDGRVNWK
jgi:hypothetical protein